MTDPAPPGAPARDRAADDDGVRPGDAGRPGRRRRRAVGPPGAVPAEPGWAVTAVAPDERPPEDDDARLRREVPPHHGG